MPLTTFRNRSHLFSMKDIKNSVASRWQEQPPLKTIFISILQTKSSSTWLITASLCEGPIFFTFMLSQPIPLYLKQAFELLWSNHPYVDLFNHVSYFPLFSMILLSEWIYLWKLSMTVKRLLWLSMWFLLYNLWYKRLRSKYKYNLFIVLWPRTKVCHHQSWFTLCTFIVIPFAHCRLNYIKGSCYLLWFVPW
jgi:hypothetical protein